ncbi:MAG TPA: hypothetical protein VN282_01610 [Pyrinomonadaceae bacterium]|nr:hypothetical protein [Pyrinomonadaceae bacterium]
MLNDTPASPTPTQRSFLYRFCFIVILLLVGVFGVLQTQLFVILADKPSLERIKRQMKVSEDRQREIGARFQQRTGRRPHDRIYICAEPLFSKVQYKAIEEATNSLLEDDDTLPYFKTSLKGVRAVILPAWELETQQDYLDFGITPEGARHAPAVAGHPLIPALTLRDRDPADQGGFPHEVTEDGTPRIAINLSAFESKERLRLTIFHELLHAGNVPGYDASRFTVLQTDLAYLSEYRGYIAREGLEGWRELKLWGWWVVTPWGVSMLLIMVTPWRRSRSFQWLSRLSQGVKGRIPGLLRGRQRVVPLPGEVGAVPPDDPQAGA